MIIVDMGFKINYNLRILEISCFVISDSRRDDLLPGKNKKGAHCFLKVCPFNLLSDHARHAHHARRYHANLRHDALRHGARRHATNTARYSRIESSMS